MILYDYFRSSCAYRVRIALNLKGLAYERRAIDLRANDQHAAEYRARNPQALVPTLEVDGLRLTQSLAIIDWLDSHKPEPRLIPEEPAARARVMAQALSIAADIQPLGNLRVMRRLGSQFGADEPARNAWSRHWITEGFTALEASAGADGPFLGGDAPNVADVCLVPQMFNARRVDCPLDAFPRLVAADAAMTALAPVAAAHPERAAEAS
jgi:maleylacetoacetate isomerase